MAATAMAATAMVATAEVVRRIDADGVDYRNDAQNKGNVADVPVPAHCLDHATLGRPVAGALEELQREASGCRLTEEQVAHFEAHGWVAGVRVLSDADVAKLRADCDAIAAGHEARGLLYEYHSNQSGDSENVLLHALGQWRVTPAFHALCYHLPIVVPVSQLLGGSAIRLFHDQLFCKPAQRGGGVAWHQDYSYWTRTVPMQHITVHIALDEQTADNGPLSFISGSHCWRRADGKPGPLPITDDSFADAESIFSVLSDEQRQAFKPASIRLRAGEASFHHALTVHGSGPNRSDGPRRATVLNYFADGTRSATDEALLSGVPVVPRGECIEGTFFPKVFDPGACETREGEGREP